MEAELDTWGEVGQIDSKEGTEAELDTWGEVGQIDSKGVYRGRARYMGRGRLDRQQVMQSY